MKVQPPSRSILTHIFLSTDRPRLRAGWRLLIQTIILIFLGILISFIVYLPATILGFSTGSLLLNQISELIVITVSVFLARRFLDKRSFVSLGLKLTWQTLYDVLAGIAIAFVMMGLVFLVMMAMNWTIFEGFAWQVQSGSMVAINVLLILIVFILVGWNEELLSRGYHLQNLSDGINLTWGVVLSSTVFGILHLGNPNATWVSAAGIFLAGLFLAYSYIRTQQLWLPIGLHIGWNFFEGIIFGFPVSGLDIYRIIHHTVIGPELWTGGLFGPEAGLIILPALIVGTILVYLYTQHRTHEHISTIE